MPALRQPPATGQVLNGIVFPTDDIPVLAAAMLHKARGDARPKPGTTERRKPCFRPPC